MDLLLLIARQPGQGGEAPHSTFERVPVERVEGRVDSVNGTVCLHGRLDRSPTGTGTTGRLAVMSAKGQIAEG